MKYNDLGRFTLVIFSLASCFPGCGSDTGVGADGGIAIDGGSPDRWAGAVDGEDTGGDGNIDGSDPIDGSGGGGADADLPELPPCTLACDRVVDCAAQSCSGVDWRTAGLAYTACRLDCDPGFASEIESAGDCDAVMAAARRQSGELNALCESDICHLSCDRFADCVIEGCPNFDEFHRGDLVNGCADGCSDDDSGDMLNASCDDLMVALSTDDLFMARCQEPVTCSGEDLCAPYGEKVGDCMVENCGGNADPFATGLKEAFYGFCMDPAECVSTLDATVILQPDVTCDGPELGSLGLEPPFDALCSGTLSANPNVMATACNALSGCGIDLGSVDHCTVLMALDEKTGAIAPCVAAASGCMAIFSCMAGM